MRSTAGLINGGDANNLHACCFISNTVVVGEIFTLCTDSVSPCLILRVNTLSPEAIFKLAVVTEFLRIHATHLSRKFTIFDSKIRNKPRNCSFLSLRNLKRRAGKVLSSLCPLPCRLWSEDGLR